MLKGSLLYSITRDGGEAGSLITGGTFQEGDILKNIRYIIKKYFRMYIEQEIDNFSSLIYRGHDLFINDPYGLTDAFTIESNLMEQIHEIDKIEDSKESE